jgi:hypothetical protein
LELELLEAFELELLDELDDEFELELEERRQPRSSSSDALALEFEELLELELLEAFDERFELRLLEAFEELFELELPAN